MSRGYFAKDLRFFISWNYSHKGKAVNQVHDVVVHVHVGSNSRAIEFIKPRPSKIRSTTEIK
jgi:hypothetical protein